MLRVLPFLIVVLCCPTLSQAGPLLPPRQTATLSFTLERFAAGFHAEFGVEGVSIGGQPVPFCDECIDPINFGWPEMFAEISSGPLTNLSTGTGLVGLVGPYPYTEYEFSDGVFTISATWVDSNGKTRTGTFSAPIIESDSDLFLISRPGLQLRVREAGGGSSPDATEFFYFGTGTFTPRLARLLGVQPHSPGGSFFLDLEDIDGDSLSDLRSGALSERDAFVDVIGVPEPSTIGLTAVSALTFFIWRRRRYSTGA